MTWAALGAACASRQSSTLHPTPPGLHDSHVDLGYAYHDAKFVDFTFVTPDGRYVVAGSVAGRSLTVIDQKTEQVAWSMKFDAGVRPMAFERNPDGSTGRIFVQLSDVHGFAVVDFAAHNEVARVTLPDLPGATRAVNIQGSPSHGIGISPSGKTLWATSKWYHFVAAYSLSDLKPLGIVPVAPASRSAINVIDSSPSNGPAIAPTAFCRNG